MCSLLLKRVVCLPGRVFLFSFLIFFVSFLVAFARFLLKSIFCILPQYPVVHSVLKSGVCCFALIVVCVFRAPAAHAFSGFGGPRWRLTLLKLQSRFGDNPLNFRVVCPQNGTAVLKGLRNGCFASMFVLSCGNCFVLFCCLGV